MERFLFFLKEAKEYVKNVQSFEKVHLVFGNESCDLDSTISALALAYLRKTQFEECLVLPVLNVEERYFALRTETSYVLKKSCVNADCLIFIDNIDLDALLSNNKQIITSLVDHHTLPENIQVLESTVTEIFDHRPINVQSICKNKGLKQTIKTVGSCATLIANEIINSKPQILFDELSYMLYATIVYDTIGLDIEAGRTFKEDIEIATKLEAIVKINQTRRDFFNLLWKIHNDTSSLSTKDLLYRDLKIIEKIPVPGLPLLVEHYLERTDSVSSIKIFAAEFSAEIIVLIGIDASNEVKRDIGVFYTNTDLKNILCEVLKEKGCDLLLTEIYCNDENLVCYKQGNIKLTRKFIMPLIEEASKKFKMCK